MVFLKRLMSFAHRPAATRGGRRRPSSPRLDGLERLEMKTPLTVEASLSGGLLTLNYLYPTDAATLAFGSDGTFMVTGDVSGATSGSSSDITQIFVMNLGNLEGVPFEYDSTQFTITGSTSVAAGLIIGDFAGSNGGIQTVALSVPGFTTNGADFSVVGGTLTIAGQIDTSGASGGAGGGAAGEVAIMALSGGISLPSAIIATGGDGSAGGGSGGGVALVASGAIAVDGAIEASGGSGGTAGGNGGAVRITAGTSVVVSGAIETFGMGGGTEGGSGGAMTITAGTSATVGGDIETHGGSGGTAGGSGGAVTITAGEAISIEAVNAASGGRYATAGVVTIDQDDPGVTSAVTSFALRSAARPSGGVAVGRITGGDVSVHAVSGAIHLVGDMILNGDASFDGPVELGLPIRVDTSFESGGVTFTSTVDGRRPLVVAAGTGAVSFQGAVGAARPLAGLRLASAGSVTAAGQVHVAGGVAGALRHGIEIAPSARNVNLSQGGSIRRFRSGQAIHAPGGSAGSTISGFRIANSGRPFVGYSADGVTTLGSNQVVSPVVRWATDRITTPAGRTNDSTPTLSGTARSGDQVTLYADGRPVGATFAVNGRWSITSAALADGRRSFTVRAVGPAGVAAEFSPPVVLSIKTAIPQVPTIRLARRSDSDTVGDMRTSDTRPWLVGTSDPGTRVRVLVDGRVAGVATASAAGTWRLRIATPLPRGSYLRYSDLRATAADGHGNKSEAAVSTLVTDTRSLDTLFDDYLQGVARNPAERAYALKAFEGYLWGGSFAWFYTRQQRQAYAAAGPRGVGTPLNALYAESAVSPESTGRIGPDVDVTYGEGWLRVVPGSPVVVHFPSPNDAGGHFMMMQVANSSSQTIASFSTFADSPDDSSIPHGGDILFYAADDTNHYAGDFVRTVAVNTEVVLATGRVLTGVGLPADNPFGETRSAELAARFVAAEYSAYQSNGLSMAGLANATSTTSDAATLSQLVRYSVELTGLHFWEMFGEALVQSPLPTSGTGSQLDWQGRTPAEYLATFASLGLTAAGWSPAGLSRRQLEILDLAATRAHQMITDMVARLADHPGTAWTSVPWDLGAYPNNPIGYLERDVAHVANLPTFAVYPTLSRDSAGDLFAGRNTYVIVLPASSQPSTPPLAEGAEANHDGFWSLNIYDGNFNVTPSLPGYLDAVARLRPSTPAPIVANPANAGGVPNISISSLQTPETLGSTVGKEYRVEPNGDVILILSPTRPRDSRYWNNWLPTPLVTFDNPKIPNGSGRFVRNDQFSAMLRVYTPALYRSEGQAKLLSEATPAPQQWLIPKIHKATGLAALERIEQADVLAAIARWR